MIAYLQGTLLQIDEEVLILNVRGVGYELHCSAQTLASLTGLASAQLRVHTHVREDALQLYGFGTRAEKEMFLSLIKVNGIGPKGAMKILSGAPLNLLISMIENSDAKALSGLPKVGKKTAEQIILALKGKLVLADDERLQIQTNFAARTDIVSALVNLGFKIQDVEKVVDKLDVATDFETGIKRGLAQLAGTF